jgi:hypothetical protein
MRDDRVARALSPACVRRQNIRVEHINGAPVFRYEE